MSANLRNYIKTIYTLDAVVQRAPADGWDRPSPCDGWTAREVLGHFLWGVQRVTSLATDSPQPTERAEADVAGPDPVKTWSATRDQVLEALDHQGVLAKNVNGPFGPSTLDSFLEIHATDGLLHTWDVARSFDMDAHLPADLSLAGLARLAAAGDALRRPGVFGPEVKVSDDADVVTRFVAMAGRNPA